MSDVHNQLIDYLAPGERASLLAQAETVELTMSEVLCEPGQIMRRVYFPSQAFISLVASLNGAPALEVGLVGREGMLGAHLLLGVGTAPLHALVQGSGTALRIGSAAFQRELGRSAGLRRLLGRYLYVSMAQLAGSAACLRFHHIGPRLARWLLMSQDCAGAERFHVTQEFLAYMLGVRRVGITQAAGMLQRSGLIDYHRGEITVTDRGGLERAACECYANNRQAYDSALG